MDLSAIMGIISGGKSSTLAPILEKGLSQILDKAAGPVLIRKNPESGEIGIFEGLISTGEIDGEKFIRFDVKASHNVKTLLKKI